MKRAQYVLCSGGADGLITGMPGSGSVEGFIFAALAAMIACVSHTQTFEEVRMPNDSVVLMQAALPSTTTRNFSSAGDRQHCASVQACSSYVPVIFTLPFFCSRMRWVNVAVFL